MKVSEVVDLIDWPDNRERQVICEEADHDIPHQYILTGVQIDPVTEKLILKIKEENNE